MKQISIIMGAGAIACGVAFAQSEAGNVIYFKSGDAAKMHAEGVAIGAFGTARLGLIGPMVKGAPYTADGVTETTQVLGDGTHINRKDTYTIYRDGEGRIRRERGDQAWISDPVASASYVLNTKEQTAQKLSLSRIVADKKMAAGAQAAKWKAEGEAGPIVFRSGGMAGSVSASGVTTSGVMVTGEPPKTEALGKQPMEGVEVEGTRTTTVIPQGQIGNDRPLQIVHERWESAELHVTILSRHTDPMMGESTERLTNVRRGEPDPLLFQVPAGYTMEAEK